jgi:preprotein translocase subunit SecG
MAPVILVIHLLIALALIGVVLLQRSEGGALGIGGGGGGSLFTSRGAANVLTRTTAFLAVGFFATSLVLSVLARPAKGPGSILDTVQPPASTQQQPAGQDPAKGVLPQLPEGPRQPQAPVSQ